MKVSDVMVKGVICAHEFATVSDVAEIMRINNIGDVCLCNDNKKLVGIITDRDIAINVLPDGVDPDSATVNLFMTSEVATASPDMSLEDCARMMAREQVRRLPVTEEATLLGIISIDDLVLYLNDPALFFDTYKNIVKYVRPSEYPDSYLRAA